MAGTAPVVTWRKYEEGIDAGDFGSWSIGTVDAGSTSTPDMVVLVWNNRTGVDIKSDMTNCTITTKSNEAGQVGTDTGELVTDKWINVKVDSASESVFTPVGGANTHPIKADGAPAGTIRGSIVTNPADLNASKENYAKIAMHATVSPTATAGLVKFLLRVSYQYV